MIGESQKIAVCDRLQKIPGGGLCKKGLRDAAKRRGIGEGNDVLLALIQIIGFLNAFFHVVDVSLCLTRSGHDRFFGEAIFFPVGEVGIQNLVVQGVKLI